MSLLPNAFDSNNHQDMNSFEPIPAGEYLAKITESEIKDTAAGTGKYVKLKFEVIEGEYKGRLIWNNLNIINPNPTAVEIAQKELATICRAIGKPVIQDTNELHGIPMLMKVRIVPAKGDYPASNSPTGYKSADNVSLPSQDAGIDAPTEKINEDEIPWG